MILWQSNASLLGRKKFQSHCIFEELCIHHRKYKKNSYFGSGKVGGNNRATASNSKIRTSRYQYLQNQDRSFNILTNHVVSSILSFVSYQRLEPTTNSSRMPIPSRSTQVAIIFPLTGCGFLKLSIDPSSFSYQIQRGSNLFDLFFQFGRRIVNGGSSIGRAVSFALKFDSKKILHDGVAIDRKYRS